MSRSKKIDVDTLDAQNAAVLAELVVDPATTEHIRVQILNKLLEAQEDQSFFDTMLQEGLDLGECPHCGHLDNWLIPETELNIRGVVTAERDPRVKLNTTAVDCPEFQEACQKKKVTA